MGANGTLRTGLRIVAAGLSLAAGAYFAAITVPARGSNPRGVTVPARGSNPRGVTVPARGSNPLAGAPVIAELEALSPALEPNANPDELASSEVYDPTGYRFRDGELISGRSRHRLLLFTFDDGPDWRYTPRLLDLLDDLGIKAVFFLTAERIAGRGPQDREHAEIARDIARRGHLIGNHTYSHRQLPLMTDLEVLADFDQSEAAFVRVLGRRPWLIRPPGGARSARVDRLLAGRGYTQVLWNLGAGESRLTTPQGVRASWEKVLARREREDGEHGGIILLHDLYEWAVDALPLIVSEIRRRNCDLLERGEELYDIVDDLTLFFEPRQDSPGAMRARAAPEPAPHILEQRQSLLRLETQSRCLSNSDS